MLSLREHSFWTSALGSMGTAVPENGSVARQMLRSFDAGLLLTGCHVATPVLTKKRKKVVSARSQQSSPPV